MRRLAASIVMLAIALPADLCAQQTREALVIGNGTYAALPSLPACLLSAHSVGAALRAAGFDVIEREDVSAGGADAAIGEFANRLAASPGGAAFVYTCGYATSFNERAFLLPVSARIMRQEDVLTQGIVAKSLIDVLTRNATAAGVAAIDAVAAPGFAAPLHFDALMKSGLADGLGLLVATQPKPPDAVTPLAEALASGLKAPEIAVSELLDRARQRIGGNGPAMLAAFRLPPGPRYLIEAKPTPAPVTTAPAPVLQADTLPADEEMTDADRRRVQAALVRLGYYAGRVDGIFGPDSRAAIRRYQHELRADMTGRLTAAQASQLISSR